MEGKQCNEREYEELFGFIFNERGGILWKGPGGLDLRAIASVFSLLRRILEHHSRGR